MTKKVLVTAALPYVNNVPHLGHIAGSHLPADIYTRFSRAKGYDTLLIGGTDESGSPSELAAESLNIPLKEFSKKLYEIHSKIYKWFGISYDNFSRTSRQVHTETAQEFFKEIYKNKYITEGTIKVFYSPTEDRYLADRFIIGNCPKCDYESASGDQCEKCTSVYNETELKNPKSAISGKPVEIVDAKHLFLRLDKLEPKIKKWIDKQKSWKTQVKGIANGWIKEGLKERCITRDLKNGIPVPIKGFEDKVMYVWFEAPIGYVSSTKELLPDKWEDYWKGKDTKIIHFLGKDNIPFHTIFWPAIIIASDNKVNLPTHVEGYQYLNFEGGKFSKSKGRGVFCENLPESGIDPELLRTYITQILPETSDSEFKWDDFKTQTNSNLIGNLSNFINRTLKFIESKLNGKITKPTKEDLTDLDIQLQNKIDSSIKEIENLMENSEIRKAYNTLLSLSSEGNKYFDETKPWVLVKENPEQTEKILYQCANLCKSLAILSFPFIPNASQKIWNQLGLKGKVSENGIWDKEIKKDLPKEHKIGKPDILFKTLDDDFLKNFKEKVSKAPDLKKIFKK